MKLALPLTLISLAALGGALAFTNPSEDDYAAFLSDRVETRVQAEVCGTDALSNWLGKIGDALGDFCQSLVSEGGDLTEAEVQSFIKESTDYKNRFLFSTYTTEFPFGTYKGVAVFNQFLLRELEEES